MDKQGHIPITKIEKSGQAQLFCLARGKRQAHYPKRQREDCDCWREEKKCKRLDLSNWQIISEGKNSRAHLFPTSVRTGPLRKTRIACKALINKPKSAVWKDRLTPLDVYYLTGQALRPHVRGDCNCGREKMNAICKLVKNQLEKASSAFVIIRKANRVLKCRTF